MREKKDIRENFVGRGYVINNTIQFSNRGKVVLIDNSISLDNVPEFYSIVEFKERDKVILVTKVKEEFPETKVTVYNGRIDISNDGIVNYASQPFMQAETLTTKKYVYFPEVFEGYEYSLDAEENNRVYLLCEDLKTPEYRRISRFESPAELPHKGIFESFDTVTGMLTMNFHYYVPCYSRYYVVKKVDNDYEIAAIDNYSEKSGFISKTVIVPANVEILKETQLFDSVVAQRKIYDNAYSGDWNPFDDYRSEDVAEWHLNRMNNSAKFKLKGVLGHRKCMLVRFTFEFNDVEASFETWVEQRQYLPNTPSIVSENYIVDLSELVWGNLSPITIVDYGMNMAGVKKSASYHHI